MVSFEEFNKVLDKKEWEQIQEKKKLWFFEVWINEMKRTLWNMLKTTDNKKNEITEDLSNREDKYVWWNKK